MFRWYARERHDLELKGLARLAAAGKFTLGFVCGVVATLGVVGFVMLTS